MVLRAAQAEFVPHAPEGCAVRQSAVRRLVLEATCSR